MFAGGLRWSFFIFKKQEFVTVMANVMIDTYINFFGGCVMSAQVVYSATDVATVLQIKESTLRKYALLLQKESYEFALNEHGHRLYSDTDLVVLRKMIEHKDKSAMTLKQAAQAVVAWQKNTSVSDAVTSQERYNDLLQEFADFKEQQNNFNKALLERLDKQQNYIENSVAERDRNLMETLKELQDTKKQIAAAVDNEKKWWQFWK